MVGLEGNLRGDRVGVGAVNTENKEFENVDGETNFVEIDVGLATNRAEYYQSHSELSSDQLTNYAKWLNSSLLAINGAGVISIINAFDKIEQHAFIGMFFIFGLMSTLFSGWLLQFYYLRSSNASSELWLIWRDSITNGEIDLLKLGNMESKIIKIGKLGWMPPVFGWLSAISFLTGVILFIDNLKIN